MLKLVSWRFVIKDSLCVLICCTSCVCHISSLSLSHTRSCDSRHVFASTVIALLELSDTQTFERYPVVSVMVAELYDSSNVEIGRQTGSLGRGSDPDSFDDFAAHCCWYRDGLRESERGLATAHVVRFLPKVQRRGT